MKLFCFNDAIQPDDAATPDNGLAREEIIALIILVVAAIGIRCYLVRFHDVISCDGIGYVKAAQTLAAGDPGKLAYYGFYPVLIWFAGLFVVDLELAGRMVSILLGSLLVVPLYLLGKEFFSRQTTLAACLVAAAWPTLVSWSCDVMTQATYITLTITGFYLVRRMFRAPSAAAGCMAGLILGLAYLTRTEAALLFLVMPIAAASFRCRKFSGIGSTLVFYLAGFMLLLVANILLVHHVTGVWQLAAKTSNALNDALSAHLKIPDLNYVPDVKPTCYLDIIRNHPAFLWSNSISNLLKALETMLPAYLWILALIGFLSGGWSAGRNAGRLFLLATFAPLPIIIVFYYIGPEYTQPYLPVLLFWAAEGLRQIEQLLASRFPALDLSKKVWGARISLTLAIALALSITLLIQQLPAQSDPAAYLPSHDGGRRDQKRIGLLLKENLPPGKFMTRSARIAYYAEREWTNIPQASYVEILQTARRSGVRYLIVDGKLKGARPQLRELFMPLNSMPPGKRLYVSRGDGGIHFMGLKLCLIYHDPSSLGVVVYDLTQ